MYQPPTPHGQYGRFASFAPAGQATFAPMRPAAFQPSPVTAQPPVMQPASTLPSTALPADACPTCAHCPSLPSSDSAYDAISGAPGGWISVIGTTLLRSVLVGAGIATYDAIAKNKNPYIIPQAIAGAVGIEIFVLGWTWLKAPRP